MPNSYFQFKQFTVYQDKCAMKVTTDSCLFGSSVADKISKDEAISKCLDIGSGTGLLSLMLSQKTNCHIDALEIDDSAAKQAKENVASSPFADKINVIKADARKFLSPVKYDIIISNPPFYENELKGDSEKKNIAHHSEELSLAELINVIKKNLNPAGKFYLLLPYKRKEEIESIINLGSFQVEEIIKVKQTEKHDYFRIMLTGKFKTDNSLDPSINEIAIKEITGDYTSLFVNLLKDYYLYL